ncbi:hypothetical protein [Dysgonomonas sp. Marseille-P4361]|uniref:hypothetical protein n=1 Tax=Dysgonomonas sp. Marseille-P4361 TaxID=2161820 RepID=UPI000D55B52C|nr:hypothetical protein [Dysgonomonas sp. Marseille-P4361]
MEKENKSPKFSPRMIFGLFMVVFYLFVAILLVFTPIFKDVHIAARIIMGILFFAYGLFRGYRAWKQF